MALNLSRGSVLPKYPSPEHSLCSSVRCSNGYVRDQCKEKSLDGDASSSNAELKKNTHYKGELGGYCEPSVDDILDRLPVDPFGMDMRSTFTAISGWLEDFEKGCESYGFGVDEQKKKVVDGGLFAGLNWVWNSAVIFQPELGEVKFDGISIPYDSFDGFGINDGGFVLDDNVEEFLGFGHVVNLDVGYGAKELPVGTMERPECSIKNFDSEGGAPHDAMFYALGYLGVQDLLSVQRVCRSLNHAVKSDPLLWRSINIDWPLNERITDDALVNLTSRAQGNLQTLSLVHCAWITDVGLHRVFDSNPRLTKLSIPGCIKISVESILLNLRTLKSAGKPGIKQLRIGGLSGITDKQFEELKFLLGADNHTQVKAPKPRYFHGGLSYLSCDDDCAIDIEACPRCQRLSLVYDCPAESCQGKYQKAQMCRACILCITRCISCGCCLGDCDYVETFCLQLLCLECLENLLNCQERHGENGATKCAIFCQESRYQFCLFG
ncbi:putative F-box domain, leucine-rich repeat domain, L domain-containing protein [Rosa chinensis]|uniref:Putative F-box domain, leucine-rich repeat domain, L domain-containing protein n=1 Tax=Rosa chinensis TaxID=74649 RepID=A0A2P6S652_ROSCH|nr:F-box protein SKIP14 [Rosa chinensis]PRQ54139.1 putative F-box domain, leucine-rich repeat domain, L domain-containing protein [Rosa chinensis]